MGRRKVITNKDIIEDSYTYQQASLEMLKNRAHYIQIFNTKFKEPKRSWFYKLRKKITFGINKIWQNIVLIHYLIYDTKKEKVGAKNHE